MNLYQKRIKEVYSYFENNDVFLGFRKLLDCVMDTQDMHLYNEAIALTDWKEKNEKNVSELKEKVHIILEKLAKKDLSEAKKDTFVLKADNIYKKYGSGHFALKNISLTIAKGEVYGLVGENGNGKTTLLRILAKELSYDSGKLEFHFIEKEKNEYDLRTKLVYIPQRTEKWYGTLMDNLRFVLANYNVPANEIESRVLLMIARLGLWNYKHLKWSELSSGYKMRFELARTLLRKPEILLLDEPLANLDIMAQQVILDDLKSIANSLSNPIALILSSQQLYEVEKISDQVIFLRKGEFSVLKNNEENEKRSLIIELDTKATREELLTIFKLKNIQNLNFNGGIYVIKFTENESFSEILSTIGESNLKVTYVRDISESTRRFFVN